MGEANSPDCTGPTTHKYAIRSPDFLAVSANATQAPGVAEGKPDASGQFNVSQIFATGRAANAAANIPAVGKSFRDAIDQSTQAATAGTVGNYGPDKNSGCIDKWRRGADGKVDKTLNGRILKAANALGTDIGNFLDLKQFEKDRAVFIKEESITCT